MRQAYSDEEVVNEANLIAYNDMTLREISSEYKVGLSTLWWHIHKRLPKIDKEKYETVSSILTLHFKKYRRK